MLLGGQGKLGYSLALSTHLETLSARLRKMEHGILKARGRAVSKAAASYGEELRRQEADCLMCDRIRANLLNFSYTIAKLFLDEPDFAAVLEKSRGFCLHHLPGLVEMGAEVVPAAKHVEWHEMLFDLQRRNIEQIRDDLEAFTWQFDYQTEKKTPPHARDAVARAVARLAGYGPR
jgi:hypothetical protein